MVDKTRSERPKKDAALQFRAINKYSVEASRTQDFTIPRNTFNNTLIPLCHKVTARMAL